jgi:hypothetical protein
VRASGEGPPVELHWKTDPDSPVERLGDEAWWREAGTIDGLPTFRDEDLLLVLCIHGSKHFWSSLGWLVDVAELLRSAREVDWCRFAARAQSLGAARRVGLGLRLASDLLQAPLPEPCEALARRADVERLAVRLQVGMLAAEPRLPGAWESTRLRSSMYETWSGSIRDLLRTVCLPSLVEWTRWPLPRPLFFAYPALRMGRLAGKYARRGLETAFGRRKLQS